MYLRLLDHQKGAGATEAVAATTATEEAVAEAAAAQQQQQCHGSDGGGRRGSRGDGNNSSGGGDRGSSGGNKGSRGGAGATEGVAATALDSSLRSVEYLCFFSNKFISFVSSYVGPIQTGFLRGFQKSYGGTGIVIPVKRATGTENTGIRRIPAGITNLGKTGISVWLINQNAHSS
jgi:hypothetical protein